jgi:general secretion pathway protein C
VIIEQDVFSGTRSSPRTAGFLRASNAADVVPSAEVDLGLVLMGTISGSPVASRAILRDVQSNVQEEYRLGDVVAGARVQSIEKNAVVLLHNGQSKVLRLQVGRNHPQSNTKASVSQAGSAVANAARSDSLPIQPAPQMGGQLDTIMSSATIEPYSVNGQTEGLRISGLDQIPVVRDIGLRDGDVIREVNGHQLTNKRKAYQVLQKAKTQPTLSVELQRAGRTKELSFALP